MSGLFAGGLSAQLKPMSKHFDSLWDGITSVEFSMERGLSLTLEPFFDTVKKCHDCGAEVCTLKGNRKRTNDLRVSALFLKRSLNDLRGVWKLLLLGYTSQAGSVAAAAFENATLAACTAGDIKMANRLLDSKTGDIPWTVLDLCKIDARQGEEDDARRLGRKLSDRNYEVAWRAYYGEYMWFCKLKHPNMTAALHDAFSTPMSKSEFVVTAFPDARDENLTVKCTILCCTAERVHNAAERYSRSMELDEQDARVVSWLERMDSIMPALFEAHDKLAKHPLPFSTDNSKIADEWRAFRRMPENS
jgi:hypothetical protein